MAEKITIKEKDVILKVTEVNLTQSLNNNYENLENKPDLSVFLESSNIIQGNNIILQKQGNDIIINSSGGGSGSIENTGDGIGVYKDSEFGLALLKSIKSIEPIILINDNLESNTIDFSIDYRSFNSAIAGNLEGINEQITLIQSNLEGIYTDINNIYDSLNNNVANIYSAIAEINTSIDNINLTLNGISSQVASNTAQINTINTNISSINGSITSINTTISNLQGRMNTAESNISTNTSNISTNTSNISNLQGRMNTAESNISTNTSNISTNTTAITNLNAKVVPPGGTTGQVLTKNSATNYDATWITPSSGGSGSDFAKELIYGVWAEGNGISGTGQTLNTVNCSNQAVGQVAIQQVYYEAGNESYGLSPKLGYQLSTTGATGIQVNPILLNFSPYDEGFTAINEWGLSNSPLPTGNSFNCGLGNPNSVQNPDAIFTTNPNYFFLGIGHSSTDTQYYLVMNMYGLSLAPIKISLSNFIGNLQASDYAARTPNNHYKLTITNAKNSTYVTITFTNITTGRSGSYNFNFSDMLTFDRNVIAVRQLLYFGASSTQGYYHMFKMCGSKKLVF